MTPTEQKGTVCRTKQAGKETGSPRRKKRRTMPVAASGDTKTKSLRARSLHGPSTDVSAGAPLRYTKKIGVDAFVRQLSAAAPLQSVKLEQIGVAGFFVKDLSERMGVPKTRMFKIIGMPKATAEKKAAAGTQVAGSAGHALIAMAKLLGIAQEILSISTADTANGFDTAKWLGRWIEGSQPALGGRSPAELLNSPTGFTVVARLLGAVASGSYQ